MTSELHAHSCSSLYDGLDNTMSGTVLFDCWYTALRASQELERAFEEMERLYKDGAAA